MENLAEEIRKTLKDWLQITDGIVFTDDLAINEVTAEIVEACRQKCTIPVVSGSLPLASEECDHPYALVYRKGDYEVCLKCNKVLCEG